MSHFLMMYIDENISFDPVKTIKAIQKIDNATLNISKKEHSEGFGNYAFEGEETNINIGKDWKFIVTESSGKAALDFAMTLNQLLNENLTLTDSNYSFLCRLNRVYSVEELEDIISQEIYDNE